MKINMGLVALFLCIATISTAKDSHSTIPSDNQPYQLVYNSEIENLNVYAPVEFTPNGLRSFLHTYNRIEYGQDVLPNNFDHVIQFLKHGKRTKQKSAYAKSVFKLFGNKIKSAQYVNSYAFSELLEQLPNLLADYFVPQRNSLLSSCSGMVYDILYDTFLSKFDQFKNAPDDFLKNLSRELTVTIHEESDLLDEESSTEQLRQSTVRFLEICSGKLIWSPDDKEKVWLSLKNIARQIGDLTNSEILPNDEADDLYWSLIHRFCFFLDITCADLSIEFYETIKKDLVDRQLAFLELAEQEALIETKRQCLMRSLFKAEAKKRAVDRGILIS